MGLDCSHEAFSGAYSAFNRFRRVVAKAWGGSFPPHENPTYSNDVFYTPDDIQTKADAPGLWTFLEHSDCDGQLTPDECRQVADELEALLPRIAALDGEADAGGAYCSKWRLRSGDAAVYC